MQQKRPKRYRFGRDLCVGVCLFLFACMVYACQICMSIRCADTILEWGLLDRTRFACKTAQFAKGKLESPSPPDALAEICPRSVPKPNQKINRAFSGF